MRGSVLRSLRTTPNRYRTAVNTHSQRDSRTRFTVGSPGISPSRENTSQVRSGQEQRGDVFHFVLNQTSKRATMSAALDDLVDLKRRDCSTLRMISPC